MKTGFLFFIFLITWSTDYGQSAADLRASGNKKFNDNDYEGAIEDYSKAIEKNPNDDTSYAYRGFAKHHLKITRMP